MRVSSNWKLTFDPAGGSPLVLLDHSQIMEDELVLPLRKGLEVVDLPDAAAPFLRPTGNNSYALELKCYHSGLTDAAARKALMERMVAMNSAGRKPLKVELHGVTDRHWLFANCALTGLTGQMVLDGSVARYLLTYNLTSTGLSQVGP